MVIHDPVIKEKALKRILPEEEVTTEVIEKASVELIRTGNWDGYYMVSVGAMQGTMIALGNGVSEYSASMRKERGMIPKEYKDKRANSFNWNVYKCDISNSKNIVNSFILNFDKYRAEGMGLYIYSDIKGSGKTMLSCCILNEIAHRHDVSFKFINIFELFEITKKGYSGFQEEEQSLYECSLLVIDDIGAQMEKEWINTVLYRLINHRYTNKQITIYTSNIEVEQLNIDDRIIDRIESTSYIVRLPEVPVRKIMSAERKKQLSSYIATGNR